MDRHDKAATFVIGVMLDADDLRVDAAGLHRLLDDALAFVDLDPDLVGISERSLARFQEFRLSRRVDSGAAQTSSTNTEARAHFEQLLDDLLAHSRRPHPPFLSVVGHHPNDEHRHRSLLEESLDRIEDLCPQDALDGNILEVLFASLARGIYWTGPFVAKQDRDAYREIVPHVLASLERRVTSVLRVTHHETTELDDCIGHVVALFRIRLTQSLLFNPMIPNWDDVESELVYHETEARRILGLPPGQPPNDSPDIDSPDIDSDASGSRPISSL